MKTFARAVIAASVISLGAGASPTFAQVDGTLTKIVLRTCPTPLGASCVAAVQGAIDSMPRSTARSAELMAMSAALADRARGIFVTRAMCEDIVAGIRLASGARHAGRLALRGTFRDGQHRRPDPAPEPRARHQYVVATTRSGAHPNANADADTNADADANSHAYASSNVLS